MGTSQKQTSQGTDRGSPATSHTVANPHARPLRGSARSGERPLPPVEERPDLASGVRMAMQRDDYPPGLEVIRSSVWMMLYRCVYAHGYYDQIARVTPVVARDRAEAVRALQRRMFGFAQRIVLYDAWTQTDTDGEKPWTGDAMEKGRPCSRRPTTLRTSGATAL